MAVAGSEPIAALLRALQDRGVTLEPWALAWGRVLPLLLIVPAFGARWLPAPARVVLALAMAVSLIPAMSNAPGYTGQAFGVAFVMALLQGLPLALSTAALLWAAMMAGGLMDELRGGTQQTATVFSDAPTPLATLIGLFAGLSFLQLGGAARAVEALARPASADGVMLLRAVSDLVQAVGIALSLAAPMLAAVIVWEVTAALITRAASPAHMQPAFAPLRSLVVLAVLALSLDTLFELVATWVNRPF